MVIKSSPTLIRIWLRDAAEQLANALIPSALLDAEIILAHTLRRSRTWLHAHGDEPLDPRQLEIAEARLQLRLERTPVAYIIGHKEFYGRLFKVTPATLIPRPESEALITQLGKYLAPAHKRLIDVGTGSGCLGITAKLEHPQLHVTLADISRHALKVAEENARLLGARVDTVVSDLLVNAGLRYDCIVANLPYVDKDWSRSPETDHEPSEALFADQNGLALIAKLIEQTGEYLTADGLLILEADPRQHSDITSHAANHSLSHRETDGFALVFTKT